LKVPNTYAWPFSMLQIATCHALSVPVPHLHAKLVEIKQRMMNSQFLEACIAAVCADFLFMPSS
jgi:hypothetical protein